MNRDGTWTERVTLQEVKRLVGFPTGPERPKRDHVVFSRDRQFYINSRPIIANL